MKTTITFIILLAACAASLSALEIEDVIWGFNGKAVPGRMNILSFLAINPSPREFEGLLLLKREAATGEGRGALVAEPCFLAPGSSRRMQFCVFVQSASETWYLSWGKGKDQTKKMGIPPAAPPAMVFLYDRSNMFSSPARMKRFPEKLFPPSVTATDGLDSVVIDHSPSWEKPQRIAFRDWIARGGTVHILQDSAGAFPTFSGDLSFLETGPESADYLGGRIIRHPVRAADLPRQGLASRGYLPPAFIESNAYLTFDTNALSSLGDFGQGKHSWGLIYFMIVIYLILIGPVNFLIGKKARKFYTPIIYFLGCAVLFTMIFMTIGRSGYGRETQARNLTYARRMTPGNYDLTQWHSVFVSDGDDYVFQFPGTFNQISTCQDFEKVNGIIKNGVNASFQVDIPVYSRRGFLRRGTAVLAEDREFTLEKADTENGKLSILNISGSFRSPIVPEQAWAFYNGYFYSVREKDGSFVLAGKPVETEEFFKSDDFDEFNSYRYRHGKSFTEIIKSLKHPVIARSLGGCGQFDNSWRDFSWGEQRVHLFMFTALPAEFRLNHPRMDTENGNAIIHIVFPMERKQP